VSGGTGGVQPLLDGLLQQLTDQRDALDAQLRALRAVAVDTAEGVSAELVLTLYLILPSARAVADLVNGQGMCVPGVNGPRALLADDVFALLRGEAAVIEPCKDTTLAGMAREKLRRRGGWLSEKP
jgi:hypothetical protein